MNPKISEQQKSKPAYIYVRQSTLAQVRHHQESTERQYALRQKAMGQTKFSVGTGSAAGVLDSLFR
jgi:DNA invertase Pin-like site-specific DNA recombinase